MEPTSLAPEDLIRLRPFVRALVDDEASADDVLQETWLRSRAGLREDRGRPAALAWARRTAERLVWSRGRSERARNARERAVADARGPAPDPAEDLERIELLRTVLERLARLPEPDRQALTWRYLAGESAAEIAARLDISRDAARQRVHRALARLRADLDADHGRSRAAWAAPLAGLAGVVVSTGQGVPVLQLAAAAGLLATLGLGMALASAPASPESPTAGDAAAASLAEPTSRISALENESAAPPQRSGPVAEGAFNTADAAPPPVDRQDSFLVTLLEAPGDQPLAGAEVWWLASAANPIRGSARTDAEGRLVLPFDPSSHWHVSLALQPEGHALHNPIWQHHDSLAGLLADPVVRLERGVLLSGVVVLEDGTPVDGAVVSIPRLKPSYGLLGEWWPAALAWKTETDTDGPPEHWSHDLQDSIEIFHPSVGHQVLWPSSNAPLLAAMARGQARVVLFSGEASEGILQDPEGNPCPQVSVTRILRKWGLARSKVVSDDEGRYRVPHAWRGGGSIWLDEPLLLMRKSGFRERLLRPSGRAPTVPVVLAPAPTLVVRVVDAAGTPVEGAQVQVREKGFGHEEGEPAYELQPQVTGPDGSVQFESVVEGEFRLVVSSDEHDTAFETILEFDEEPVVVQLKSSAWLEVRLTAGASTPAPPLDRAVLRYTSDEEPKEYQPFVRRLENGWHRIARLRPEMQNVSVQLHVEGFETLLLGPYPNDGSSLRIETELEPASAQVEGMLLDASGTPLVGVAVGLVDGPFVQLWTRDDWDAELMRHSTRTDHAGRFVLNAGPPSSVIVADVHTGPAFSTLPELRRNRGVLRARGFARVHVGRDPHDPDAQDRVVREPSRSMPDSSLRLAIVLTSPGHEQPDARLVFQAERSMYGGAEFVAAPSGSSELVWLRGDSAASSGLASIAALIEPLGEPPGVRIRSTAPGESRELSLDLSSPSGRASLDLQLGEDLEILVRD